MTIQITLRKSSRTNKKWNVVFDNNDQHYNIHFGAHGMSDFTIHKDNKRKQNYIKRHEVSEDWNDITTAGYWSRWLLWNKKTISESIKDIESRKNVKILLEK